MSREVHILPELNSHHHIIRNQKSENLNASDLIKTYQQTPTNIISLSYYIILKYPQDQNMGSFGYTEAFPRSHPPDRQLQWHPNSQRHGLLPQPAAGRTITGHARFQAVPGDPLMDGAPLKKKKTKKVRHLEDEV